MLAGLLGSMLRQVLLNSDQVILKCQNKLHLVILSVCSGKNPHNIALWYSMLCSMYNTCCRFLNSAKPAMPCTAISLKIIHSICFFYCIVNCTSQCKLVVLFSWWSFKSLVISYIFLLHCNAWCFLVLQNSSFMFQALKKCLRAMLFSSPLWLDGQAQLSISAL